MPSHESRGYRSTDALAAEISETVKEARAALYDFEMKKVVRKLAEIDRQVERLRSRIRRREIP
jgi:hypothetical protein